MKPSKQKIVAAIIAIVVLLALLIFTLLPKTPKKTDIKIRNIQDQAKNSTQKIDLFKFFTQTGKVGFKKTDQTKKDPKRLPKELENVEVKELQIEDEPPQLTQKEAFKKEIFNKMTSSMERSLEILSSFKLEGEMIIKIPAMNPKEEDFNKGDRYGKKIEVKSRFILKKDDKGHIFLSQRTSTDIGSTRFDKQDYNKDIYLMGENYFEYDQLGNQKQDGVTKSDIEPLAQANWVRVLRDLYPAIAFDETDKDTFKLTNTTTDQGASTIKADQLTGSVEFENTTGLMTKGSISGNGKLLYGYISGAHVEFSIEMNMDEINSSPSITRP